MTQKVGKYSKSRGNSLLTQLLPRPLTDDDMLDLEQLDSRLSVDNGQSCVIFVEGM